VTSFKKEVLAFIKSQVIKEQVVKKDDKAEAERCFNYPFSAIEEAIANAVFHKGYDKQNPIEISIRPDRIEITNFPGPLPPVNQAMLEKERIVSRDTRNSRLGDFLKDLDLTEGRGTEHKCKEMAHHNLTLLLTTTTFSL
jgi:ATP-dependent DNA helicase RecG